ncbi:MAG: MotA/TolQ/ExbB proton channel family protein [Lentisphaeria bacterium]|nr:MotA/TolQ/ExbB proton channel family protein [Lentisphaeria bacterium]
MSTVTQILNWISNSLLLPVIVLLLAAMVASLVSLGGFFSTYLVLLQQRRKRSELLRKIRTSTGIDAADLDEGSIFGCHLAELNALGWNELECEKRIAEIQQGYERELERAKFLTKVGPMLGLMGTLIPMGPALAGLASGDIGSMAYNMQIAFATTVVGCLVAGVGLLVYSVKRHWYSEEISNLQYVLDRHLEGSSR